MVAEGQGRVGLGQQAEMCISRAVQHEPVTREFSLALLDEVMPVREN